MNKRTWIRSPDSFSDNRKSKTCTEPRRSIQNRKWAWVFAIVVVLSVCGARTEAQQPAKVHRIGFLSSYPASDPRSVLGFDALRQGLRDLGYVEGKNLRIEYRYGEGKP